MHVSGVLRGAHGDMSATSAQILLASSVVIPANQRQLEVPYNDTLEVARCCAGRAVGGVARHHRNLGKADMFGAAVRGEKLPEQAEATESGREHNPIDDFPMSVFWTDKLDISR